MAVFYNLWRMVWWSVTYSGWLFYFLYGFYVPSNKLNVTFTKSTIYKFVFLSILKPAFLNISVMSLRIWSVFCFDVFLKSTNSSSLYKSVNIYQVYLLMKIIYGYRQARQFWHHQNCPWWLRSSFLYFFSEGSLSLYNKDFLQCFIIRKSSSGISISSWTNRFTLVNISYDIDG